MYDFHKQKQESNAICFVHPLFQQGREDLLCEIKRKLSNTKKEEPFQIEEKPSEDFQENIEELNSRLAKLEEQERQRAWLKSECKKLQ